MRSAKSVTGNNSEFDGRFISDHFWAHSSFASVAVSRRDGRVKVTGMGTLGGTGISPLPPVRGLPLVLGAAGPVISHVTR